MIQPKDEYNYFAYAIVQLFQVIVKITYYIYVSLADYFVKILQHAIKTM